ncbi:MAG: hypothetical protein WD825_11675 [Gemmatimonadaceae bacterium]
MTLRRICAVGSWGWALALATAGTSSAQQRGAASADVVVERRGPARLSATPGSKLTLAFRLTNHTPANRTVEGRLALPDAWRLIVPNGPTVLVPRESQVALVMIGVPSSARAGAHALRYAVGASVDSVVVVVPERRRISGTVESAPPFVAAGEGYTARFTIRNAGNAPVVVRLQASATPRSPVQLDSALLHLDVGVERTVHVAAGTDARVKARQMHRVHVVANIASDTAEAVSVVSTVEVIPRQASAPSRFVTIPAQLALRREEDDRSLSAELRGAGYFSETGTNRIDFLFRGPNPRGSAFAQPNEYWVGLSAADRYQLRVGDQGYGGSRLSQSGRPTFGAAGDLTAGALTFGAFSVRDRRSFAFTREFQHGATVDASLFDRARIGAGFLTRSGVLAGDIWSLRGSLSPLAGASLGWEYGRSSGAARSDAAHTVSLNGRTGPFTYGARREAAGVEFPSPIRGSSYLDATLRMMLTRNVDIFGNFADAARSGMLQQPVIPDSRQRVAESGISFGQFISVTYQHTRQTGLLLATTPGRTSRSTRVNTGLPLSIFFFRAEVEDGFTVFDGQPTTQVSFRRYGLGTSASKGEQTLSFAIDQQSGTPGFSFVPQEFTSARAGASIRVLPGTNLNIGFNAVRYDDANASTFTMLDVGLGRALPFGHRVSWQGRSLSYPGTAQPQSMQFAEYAMPVALPVGRTRESGAIYARLVDAISRRPAGGIVVRLGDEARMTDSDGWVQFSGLDAGRYFLEVDRSKLPADHMITPATPLNVDLTSGETRRIELSVVPSVRIHGRARTFEYQEGRPLGAPDSLVDAAPLVDVALTLVDGDTVRVVPDAFGRFNFADLHPGRWVLTVSRGSTSPHGLEQERFELDLKPGDTREVLIRALPTRRPVRMIAAAELTPGRPAQPASGTTTRTTRRVHVVGPGDVSLVQIARVAYRDADLWPKLWVANRELIGRPEMMRLGDSLVVPPKAPLTGEEIAARDAYLARLRPPADGWPRADSSWRAPTVRHYYTVTRHDKSLRAIARVMYADAELWPRIWLANLDQLASPEALRPGQRLRVPEEGPLTQPEIAARNAYVASQRRR